MRFSYWTTLAAALFVTSVARAQLPPTGFEAGQAFSDLVLPSMDDGHPVSLGQFRGQKIILHVFASW